MDTIVNNNIGMYKEFFPDEIIYRMLRIRFKMSSWLQCFNDKEFWKDSFRYCKNNENLCVNKDTIGFHLMNEYEEIVQSKFNNEFKKPETEISENRFWSRFFKLHLPKYLWHVNKHVIDMKGMPTLPTFVTEAEYPTLPVYVKLSGKLERNYFFEGFLFWMTHGSAQVILLHDDHQKDVLVQMLKNQDDVTVSSSEMRFATMYLIDDIKTFITHYGLQKWIEKPESPSKHPSIERNSKAPIKIWEL